MRTDILERKEEIITMINNNESKSFICKKINCKQETLNGYLKKFGIDYKGNQGLKGKKISNKRISAIEYMKKEILSVPKLRKKLIEDGIKEDKCEKCNNTYWFGKKLMLELYHIDGNRFNNTLNNLQILCPNCHSTIPNHSKKKNKKVDVS